MSNGLDPDKDRHYVGPDQDLSCLQKLWYQQMTNKKIVKFSQIFLIGSPRD